MHNRVNQQPIGIFDSGVGGLSVLRELQEQLPNEQLIYLADQVHVPYGPRSREQVLALSFGITDYLLDRGAKIIVVACNTASAAALYPLRERYPGVPFIGMEPAVKPAAEGTESGMVGVLATPTTLQGELYASVVERFAGDVTILQDTCPGLVQRIEVGDLNSERTTQILLDALQPMMKQNVDRVVLGCTHYPFVIPVIRSIVGDKVAIIDPAPAVARQVWRVLKVENRLKDEEGNGGVEYLTSGDPAQFEAVIRILLGESTQSKQVVWQDGRLLELVNP